MCVHSRAALILLLRVVRCTVTHASGMSLGYSKTNRQRMRYDFQCYSPLIQAIEMFPECDHQRHELDIP